MSFNPTAAAGEPQFSVVKPGYHLRPEVLESMFYLWRATKDEKYRQWGAEIWRAISELCRTQSACAPCALALQHGDCLGVDCVLCVSRDLRPVVSDARVSQIQRRCRRTAERCPAQQLHAILLSCRDRQVTVSILISQPKRGIISHFSRAGTRGSSSPTTPSSVSQSTCCRPKRILCRCCRGEFIAVVVRAKWRRR